MENYIDSILKMKQGNNQMVYELSNDFFVSIIRSEEYVILCLHTTEISLQKAFHFLEKVKNEILIQIENDAETENSDIEAQKDFYKELEELISTYNTTENITEIEILKEELRSTSNLMIVNFHKIQERTEKIEVLQEKMKKLMVANGYGFRRKRSEGIVSPKKSENNNGRSKWKKALKIIVVCLVVLGLVGVALVFSFCDGFNLKSCKV